MILTAMLLFFAAGCDKDPIYTDGNYLYENKDFTPIDTTTTIPTPMTPLTDIDNNVYNTIRIGEQVWMAENLRTTKYADGTPIPKGDDLITSTTVPYWYYPNNDATNKPVYGLLYNWKAVMRDSPSSSDSPSGVQGICPTGWHVPSDAEWKQMEMTMGMSQNDAYNTGWRGNIAAKLSGNVGWATSTTDNAAGNLSAPDRNISGFSALPAGSYYGIYSNFGTDAYFWSASAYDDSFVWQRCLKYSMYGVDRENVRMDGSYSVRCVKD